MVQPRPAVARRPRAPLLGEHTAEVLAGLETVSPTPRADKPVGTAPEPVLSKHGKPFALAGVRVIDLSWFLASAGAGRFLAAHGAEVIKVEHLSRLDGMRLGLGMLPDGGRAERERAQAPIVPSPTTSVNRSGAFMEINAGKRGISLNLKDPRALDLLKELIKDADMVVEGFSPGPWSGWGWDTKSFASSIPRSSTCSSPVWASTGATSGCAPSGRPHRPCPGSLTCQGCLSPTHRPASATPTSTGSAPTRWRPR
ncbi:hypothetical protein SVIO_103180 [Streptomyces violaceusniger]|uniref:CoA transferase n=1 Tax=Streptomyces violaceusniger TaxID=68280 RepID=A0A4D4LFC4_STRVO|nr:hypothetical protein SVIO_103180 [Streptomyces violaceusniger]